MGNANKNVDKNISSAGKPVNFLPYAAVAAVVIVIAAIVFLVLPSLTPGASPTTPGQGTLPPVLNVMKPENCQFVYGTVMDGSCTGGLYPLAEVESSTGTKKFCCGKSVNLEKEAKAPLPITLPPGFGNQSNELPEVAVQNLTPIDYNGTPVLGGDKDEYGCIGSAGYSWCEIKKKCIRSWEEGCADSSILPGTTGNVLPGTEANVLPALPPGSGQNESVAVPAINSTVPINVLPVNDTTLAVPQNGS